MVAGCQQQAVQPLPTTSAVCLRWATTFYPLRTMPALGLEYRLRLERLDRTAGEGTTLHHCHRRQSAVSWVGVRFVPRSMVSHFTREHRPTRLSARRQPNICHSHLKMRQRYSSIDYPQVCDNTTWAMLFLVFCLEMPVYSWEFSSDMRSRIWQYKWIYLADPFLDWSRLACLA